MKECNYAVKNNLFNAVSSAISNEHFADKYGKRGEVEDGMPTTSIPLKISFAPSGTTSYAIMLDDPDAVVVAGYTWIHWLVANLKNPVLEENATRKSNKEFVEGTNSWGKIGYGGMAPPNAPHKYLVHVFALAKDLELEEGFSLDDFNNEIDKAKEEGKLLDTYILSGMYDD